MACNLELYSSSDGGLDVLMIDPVLDYIDQILMDEGPDEYATLQHVDGASTSYQAIFSSLQDIIAASAAANHDEDVSSLIHQSRYRFNDNGPDAACDVKVAGLRDELDHNITGTPRSFVTADVHHQGKLLQQGCKNGRFDLNSSKGSVAQNHHNAIKLNDGLLTNNIASCWGKDAAAQVLGEHEEQAGDGTFKLSSADKQLSRPELAALDLSFEDLKLDDLYTSLYVEECSSSTIATGSNPPRHKKKSVAGKGRFGERQTSELQVSVDLKQVLRSCAQAVAIGDSRKANEILQMLRQEYGASADGTGPQRIAYIFSKALAARMRGTGVQELRAMSADMPSSAEVLRATKLEFKVIPFRKLLHYFANESILKAAEGASRLHILDYGLMYGLQWPCLIKQLAERKEGPPLLLITAIELPLLGIDMAERLDESGRRLAAYAKTCNIPFQFRAIVTNKWELLDVASLLHSKSEVLVVNCINRLRHISDDDHDLDSASSARQKLLTRWHSLHPHLLVTAVVNAAHNSPFFVTRFRETLEFYSNGFDTLDTVWGDIPERRIMERTHIYRNIMNIVACEGTERVERRETYKQWHAYITRAGFEQLPIPSTILARSKADVKQHYHKEFFIDNDEKGWMVLGWKGRAMLAISAWKSCHI